MGQAQGTIGERECGVVGRNHMREVMAEDETLAYRRSVTLLGTEDRQAIDLKVTERLRFCCEEKWKTYLRCMEGRARSLNPECHVFRDEASACVQKLDREKITATSEKRHIMGLLQVCGEMNYF